MNALLNFLVAVIAIEHLGFLFLEMFLWTTPFGLKRFHMTQDVANASASLAKNMGLYNGFLAAGLLWSLIAADPTQSAALKVFFLSCIVVAGIFGGITAQKRILYLQAGPAAVALGIFFLAT